MNLPFHCLHRLDRLHRPLALSMVLTVALAMSACDPQRIEQLEEGVATEADVRAQFGQPENIWDGPNGERVFEYNRQPSGHQNYMISIGPDGRMSALRQVLNPTNFARVTPGMPMEDLRKLLGKPMKRTPYELSREEAWEWRYMDPPTTPMIFTVWLDRDMRVIRTASTVEQIK